MRAIFAIFDLKMTYFRKIRATSIAISAYLEAKFDYGYFIKKFAFGFHDSTHKISSPSEQKLRRDGDFSEFGFYF